LDTLFNVALTFAAGLLPGLAAAFLSSLIITIRYNAPFSILFVLCSIAEVFMVWIFCRRTEDRGDGVRRINGAEAALSTASSLLLLSLAACVVISILGGLIDYVVFVLISQPRNTFYPEDVFKLGLLRNNVSQIWAGILSRFPINLIDRFVVIFGGYGVSRLIKKIVKF
jgi:hypothetical protein